MKTIKFNSKQILLATFFSLFILAGTVNAKGTETGFVSNFEIAVEPKLEVEEWMVNEQHWNNTEATYFFSVEPEMDLALENWMTEENNWMPQSLAILEDSAEEKLKIENWMIQENYWN